MTTPDGTKPTSKEVEMPQMDEARNRLFDLIDRLEAALKASDTSKSAQPCCLKVLKAEEDAHKKTLAQLERMTTERDALRVQYSNKQNECLTITEKLNEMTKSRDKEKESFTNEATNHDRAKADLEAMTNARNEEKRKLTEEKQRHSKAKADLEAMTYARNEETRKLTEEQLEHRETRANLENMTGAREAVAQSLSATTRSLDLVKQEHKETKDEMDQILSTITRELESERQEHKKTKNELDAIRRPPPSPPVPYKLGYPKAGNGAWIHLSESFKINNKGEIKPR